MEWIPINLKKRAHFFCEVRWYVTYKIKTTKCLKTQKGCKKKTMKKQWKVKKKGWKTFLTVCYYLVRYAFQSESTLYNCLNVKELLARSRREIWSLSDCNWTRTHNHLVRKQTLNLLAKTSVRLRTKWSWFQVQLQSLKNFFDFGFVLNFSNSKP